MLSDVFQWSCTTNSPEFSLYRMQLNVKKIERVHNDRLRSDFYSCKAGLKVPHRSRPQYSVTDRQISGAWGEWQKTVAPFCKWTRVLMVEATLAVQGVCDAGFVYKELS